MDPYEEIHSYEDEDFGTVHILRESYQEFFYFFQKNKYEELTDEDHGNYITYLMVLADISDLMEEHEDNEEPPNDDPPSRDTVLSLTTKVWPLSLKLKEASPSKQMKMENEMDVTASTETVVWDSALSRPWIINTRLKTLRKCIRKRKINHEMDVATLAREMFYDDTLARPEWINSRMKPLRKSNMHKENLDPGIYFGFNMYGNGYLVY